MDAPRMDAVMPLGLALPTMRAVTRTRRSLSPAFEDGGGLLMFNVATGGSTDVRKNGRCIISFKALGTFCMRSDDGGDNWQVVNYSRNLGGRTGYYNNCVVLPDDENEDTAALVARATSGDDEARDELLRQLVGRGAVDVDARCRTGEEHVWAIGDATNLPLSKAGSTAHFEAPVVAERVAAIPAKRTPPPETFYLDDTWVDTPLWQVLKEHEASIEADPGTPEP